MFTKYLSRISAIAVAGVMAVSFSACNKTSAPVDTLPVGTENTVDTSAETSTEVTTKAAVIENKTSSGADVDTEAAKDKNTKGSNAGISGSTEPSGEPASPAETAGDVPKTTVATKASEAATTKESVTETTTSKVTESTIAAAQAPTEKAIEKQTEHPAQKPTEPATQAHAHSYTATVTKQPTCTAEGVKTFRCSCGDSYIETISAAGHVFGAYVYNNDATEAADGTETAACTICGAKDTRTAAGTKIAHIHNYTAAVTKAATCAEEGVKTYTCSCGSSYTEAVPVIAHSFGDYIYNDDATTEKDGTKTATCSVCGATDTVTAEGTKKTLPSWYDEHPGIPLNVATGGQRDGSLEAYYVSGQFSWSGAALGCWDFGYSMTSDYVGTYAEGNIYHGYLYK